jgi:hypothetical protein
MDTDFYTTERTTRVEFVRDDGGRTAAGYRSEGGDSAVIAIAIAGGWAYKDVYDELTYFAGLERPRKDKYGIRGQRSSARTGFNSRTVRKYLESKPYVMWTPTMKVGTGCKMHLRTGEIPMGRLVCNVSKHYTAVIDGVIHDVYNPDRYGDRCVYGYFRFGSVDLDAIMADLDQTINGY